jgi:hypothetical protein
MAIKLSDGPGVCMVVTAASGQQPGLVHTNWYGQVHQVPVTFTQMGQQFATLLVSHLSPGLWQSFTKNRQATLAH